MNKVPTESACYQYEIEIPIRVSRARVWQAIFEEIDQWWLPEFHVTGPDSTIVFDSKPGGRGLLETKSDGAWLLWYSVQMYLPAEYKVFLAGDVAPEWGGPNSSLVKIELVETDNGCNFKFVDARHGHIDVKNVDSTETAWITLFTDGLKKHVESASS